MKTERLSIRKILLTAFYKITVTLQLETYGIIESNIKFVAVKYYFTSTVWIKNYEDVLPDTNFYIWL